MQSRDSNTKHDPLREVPFKAHAFTAEVAVSFYIDVLAERSEPAEGSRSDSFFSIWRALRGVMNQSLLATTAFDDADAPAAFPLGWHDPLQKAESCRW